MFVNSPCGDSALHQSLLIVHERARSPRNVLRMAHARACCLYHLYFSTFYLFWSVCAACSVCLFVSCCRRWILVLSMLPWLVCCRFLWWMLMFMMDVKVAGWQPENGWWAVDNEQAMFETTLSTMYVFMFDGNQDGRIFGTAVAHACHWGGVQCVHANGLYWLHSLS